MFKAIFKSGHFQSQKLKTNRQKTTITSMWAV